ncbi:MAG: hybrid sensor histidine kinase/response regulator, partial [Nitrosomonas sp.]|nr:hybrid sensor histidine kinase/response regulator [Nitrosomonas sp.]
MATVMLLCLLFVVVFHEKKIQAEIVNKENHRYRALAIAKEMLQSSEDLTRMARTYVVTGDVKYERYFLDILEIRDGKQPRPHNYTSAYWHLAGIGEGLSSTYGDHYSLHELMRLAELSAQEKALLRQSHENSDELVNLERQAFAAMKGVFDDGSGDFLLRRAPDQEFAIGLLYGEDYIKNKAKIMAPIEQFIEQLGTHAQTKINSLQHELERIILFKLILLACMIVGVLI